MGQAVAPSAVKRVEGVDIAIDEAAMRCLWKGLERRAAIEGEGEERKGGRGHRKTTHQEEATHRQAHRVQVHRLLATHRQVILRRLRQVGLDQVARGQVGFRHSTLLGALQGEIIRHAALPQATPRRASLWQADRVQSLQIHHQLGR